MEAEFKMNKKKNFHRESVKNVTSTTQLYRKKPEKSVRQQLIAGRALEDIHKYRKRVKFDGGQI